MSKLCLYAVFHGNLNFSYIPKDMYPQILRRCYWPLLRIVERQGIPLGLEFSGHTLQVVNSLDPSFVRRLRELWAEGVCEVVGSGYVQAIMPLMPARVNRENLRLGNEVYEELLGKSPRVAYVNELVYSAGLPRLYRDAGYEALMVNWESAIPVHDDPALLYRPCAVPVADGGQFPVIWQSIVAYRDFQRYVESQISLDTYLERLLSHVPETGERALPMYGSDWEVFDFKPWDAHPEGFRQRELGEMERIEGLLSLLRGREDIEFVAPSALLDRFPDPPSVRLESAAYPMPYKKQGQHSMMRWAVGGRDSVRINTQCHQLYQRLQLADWHLRHRPGAEASRAELRTLWRELCFLWNSDFRTFTTEEKYVDYRNQMGAALDRASRLIEALHPPRGAPEELWLANCSPVSSDSEPVSFTIAANGASSMDHPSYRLHFGDSSVPCQIARRTAVGDDAGRLTLAALPALAVDESGVGVVRPSSPSKSEGVYRIDKARHVIETDAVRVTLMPGRGGTIGELTFPQVCPEPLVCRVSGDGLLSTLPDADVAAGDLYLEDRQGRRITDHGTTEMQYPEAGQRHEIFVPVRCYVSTELGGIWKTYRIYLHQPRLDLEIRFQWRDVVPVSFRLGRVALNPRVFDRSSLYYATTNGGEDVEHFPLQGTRVLLDQPLEGASTVRGCLGATEGWVVLGDASRGVGLVTRPGLLYSVPLLHYEELEGYQGGYLLSLAHSLGERDETSYTLWRGHSTWSLSILGGGADVIRRVRSSALLSNGGLVAMSETGSGFELL